LVRRSEPIFSYRDYEIQIINDVETAVIDRGEAYFTNCIIYGNRSEEIEIDYAQEIPSPDFNFTFTNCLIKIDTFSQNLVNCLTNQDPCFASQ